MSRPKSAGPGEQGLDARQEARRKRLLRVPSMPPRRLEQWRRPEAWLAGSAGSAGSAGLGWAISTRVGEARGGAGGEEMCTMIARSSSSSSNLEGC